MQNCHSLESIRKATGGKVPNDLIIGEIGDVLRHAPNHPGGRNYVKVRTTVIKYFNPLPNNPKINLKRMYEI